MNSCYGVGGAMGLCDWFSLAMWVFGFFGICLLTWGIVRAVISGGLQAASMVAGSQEGATTFKKERKIGNKLVYIGIAMIVVAVIIGYNLPS